MTVDHIFHYKQNLENTTWETAFQSPLSKKPLEWYHRPISTDRARSRTASSKLQHNWGPGAVPNRTLGFGVAAPHDPIHLRVRNDWQRFYKLHKDWCWVMLKPPSTMFWNYVGIILEKSVYFIICWNHTTLPIITLLFYCHEDFMK